MTSQETAVKNNSSVRRRVLGAFFATLNFRLFALSAWMLFLELFLIRWVSTEIRIFSYVNNLVLLACFMGMGLGSTCSNSRKRSESDARGTPKLVFTFVMLSVLVLAVKSGLFTRITDLLGGFLDSVIWDQSLKPGAASLFGGAALGVVLTVFMFCVIGAVFFPLGHLLGNLFNEHPKTIVAYSWNIAGSITGIWLFGALSFCYAAPWVWLLVFAALGLIFVPKKKIVMMVCALCVLFSFYLLRLPEPGLFTLWSPYQKLTVEKNYAGDVCNGYGVKVNNVGFMGLFDLSSGFVDSHYSMLLKNISRLNQYEIPYFIKKNAKDILIVGSGGGNDAAGALRQGAKSIDAVEIDPGVYRIGSRLHPEHPYQDPRVHLYIDDARSFFKKTNKKYDVISFGLLDSHVLPSSYNNARLDHYVYTLESFEEAKKLLKSGGVMTVIFATTRSWIAYRIYELLKKTFGNEPLAFSVTTPQMIFGAGGTMYVAGSDPAAIRDEIQKDWLLQKYVEKRGLYLRNSGVRITTDDWPYLYIEKPSIPAMYLCVILSLAILFIIGKGMGFTRRTPLDWNFFFLGAAFMLLEFQNISKSSLLFGATWLVNALMITAIMVLILLSNFFVERFPIKDIKVFYCLLGLSVLGLYFIPLANLNIASYTLKSTLMALVLNVPIFFAGIIFIKAFQNCPDKSAALGSNFFGACLGGLLESVSFVTGIKAVLLLVFLFYLAAYAVWARSPKLSA